MSTYFCRRPLLKMFENDLGTKESVKKKNQKTNFTLVNANDLCSS